MYSSIHSWPLQWMEYEWSPSRPGHLRRRKNPRYPLNRRLDVSQVSSGSLGEEIFFLPLTGIKAESARWWPSHLVTTLTALILPYQGLKCFLHNSAQFSRFNFDLFVKSSIFYYFFLCFRLLFACAHLHLQLCITVALLLAIRLLRYHVNTQTLLWVNDQLDVQLRYIKRLLL